ncbi:MAG: redoxin domain-containing protein [Brumimicrobium sp.]|nr:redoxin domain-containing protein [Brumimicrobium sp.]
MKKNLLLALSILFTAFGYSQVTTYSVGSTVANFTVTDTKGNSYSLYDITASGKYVLIDFFFSSCPPCQATTPIFNQVYDKYGCNGGDLFSLSVTSLSSDINTIVDQFEANYGGSTNHCPAISSEGNALAVDNQFGIAAYPTYCLIGPDNKLINGDIWPVSSVANFEAAFPSGFNPQVQDCSLGLSHEQVIDFDIYPTVSEGLLNIALPTSSEISAIILDTQGKQVFKQDFAKNNQFKMQLDLASGIYLLHIVTPEGQSQNKKFIIK